MRTVLVLASIVVALGSCAWERTVAGGYPIHRTWTCPPGSYPDEAYPLPNCAALVRPDGDAVTEIPTPDEVAADWQAKEEEARRETLAAARRDAEAAAREDALMQQIVEERNAREGVDAARAEAAAARRDYASEAGPAEVPVESVPRVVLEERVAFAAGSDGLTDATARNLEDVATALANQPGLVSIRIDGHADELQGASANEKLSGRRAQAVRDYLEQQGVPAEKLEVRALGGTTEQRGVEIVALARAG